MKQGSNSECAAWYGDGLRFRCRRCGRCCCGEPGYVWVSADEIAAMAEEMQMSVGSFSRKFVRKVGLRHSLRERSNGECCLYENGCSVYRVRPRQCVAWPFWKENIASEQAWDWVRAECPGAGGGRLYSAGEIEKISRGESSP